MKIWSSEHVFHHSWETIVNAALRKYPNPLNPAVIGIDIVDRKLERGILSTHRLIITQWNLGSYINMIMGNQRTFFASEHSEIDVKNRRMVLKTKNLSLNSSASLEENIIYESTDKKNKQTIMKQESVIKVDNMPLSNYLEGKALGFCQSNATKGREAIEWVIRRMKDEMDLIDKVVNIDKIKYTISPPNSN
ncbi:hypothetical protein SNEBB_001474 [Seison nebaliae]|nr:hypothetical protein SNEBB_001474 [Seison nebaliae]